MANWKKAIKVVKEKKEYFFHNLVFYPLIQNIFQK